MNRTPVTGIAPQIFRKRLLVEGFFGREVEADVIQAYFDRITDELDLTTYGPAVIHRTSGQGSEINEGFDAFVPLVESGIYIAVWLNARFLSTVIYSCARFDEDTAVDVVREFFELIEHEAAVF